MQLGVRSIGNKIYTVGNRNVLRDTATIIEQMSKIDRKGQRQGPNGS